MVSTNPECQWLEGDPVRRPCLPLSLLQPQNPEQCLAHWRSFTNLHWIIVEMWEIREKDIPAKTADMDQTWLFPGAMENSVRLENVEWQGEERDAWRRGQGPDNCKCSEINTTDFRWSWLLCVNGLEEEATVTGGLRESDGGSMDQSKSWCEVKDTKGCWRNGNGRSNQQHFPRH